MVEVRRESEGGWLMPLKFFRDPPTSVLSSVSRGFMP